MPSSKLSDYEVIAGIGSGTFGTCKKIRRKTDGKVNFWLATLTFGDSLGLNLTSILTFVRLVWA